MRTAAVKGSGTRKRKQKRKQGFRPRLLLFRIAAIIICAFILWSVYLIWLINKVPDNERAEKADAGIVLGAALWNDVPSPALRERLMLALQLYEEGRVDKLILSGGLGGINSTITEAEGMKAFLVAKGVPENKLLLEEQAKNTYQNVVFSRDIALRQDISSVLIITHDYHAARAMDVASYAGMDNASAAVLESKVLNPVFHTAREVLALTKWKLERLMLKLGILSSESLL